MNKLYILAFFLNLFSVIEFAEAADKHLIDNEWRDLSNISKQSELKNSENAQVAAEQKQLQVDNEFPQPNLSEGKKGNRPQPVILKGNELLDEVINDMPIDQVDFGLTDKISKIINQPEKNLPEVHTSNSLANRKLFDHRISPSKFFRKNSNQGLNKHLPKFMMQSELSGMLFSAVLDGDINTLKTLFERGADINARTKGSGMTPLMISVRYSKPDVLRYLIVKGADINAQSFDGKTALHFAALHDLPKIFEILIKSGSKPYIKDNEGIIANEYVNEGQKSRYYLIVARNTKGNADSLNEFAKNSSIAAVNYLIETGIDFNMPDNDGNTPLMNAAANGGSKMVSFLLAKGALFDNKNAIGFDAFDLAKKNGDYETISLIETAMISRELEIGETINRDSLNQIPQLITNDLSSKEKDVIKNTHEKALDSVIVMPQVYEITNHTDQSIASKEVIISKDVSENMEYKASVKQPTFLEKIKNFFNSDSSISSDTLTSNSDSPQTTVPQRTVMVKNIEEQPLSPLTELHSEEIYGGSHKPINKEFEPEKVKFNETNAVKEISLEQRVATELTESKTKDEHEAFDLKSMFGMESDMHEEGVQVKKATLEKQFHNDYNESSVEAANENLKEPLLIIPNSFANPNTSSGN